MRHQDTKETFAIAEILVNDTDELVQKAVVWMLRVAGDITKPELLSFHNIYVKTMLRPLFRNANENLIKNNDYSIGV